MAQICGKARYRAISAHMWGSIELLSLGVQGGVVYADESCSAAFEGCSFTQCSACYVRLHSHIALQALSLTAKRGYANPSLEGLWCNASAFAVASTGALLRSKESPQSEQCGKEQGCVCELTCEDAGVRLLRLSIRWCQCAL